MHTHTSAIASNNTAMIFLSTVPSTVTCSSWSVPCLPDEGVVLHTWIVGPVYTMQVPIDGALLLQLTPGLGRQYVNKVSCTRKQQN